MICRITSSSCSLTEPTTGLVRFLFLPGVSNLPVFFRFFAIFPIVAGLICRAAAARSCGDLISNSRSGFLFSRLKKSQTFRISFWHLMSKVWPGNPNGMDGMDLLLLVNCCVVFNSLWMSCDASRSVSVLLWKEEFIVTLLEGWPPIMGSSSVTSTIMSIASPSSSESASSWTMDDMVSLVSGCERMFSIISSSLKFSIFLNGFVNLKKVWVRQHSISIYISSMEHWVIWNLLFICRNF